jgi:hypothetical protein
MRRRGRYDSRAASDGARRMTAPASTISKPCPSTGETAQLASQRGKVLLIVNTASACGFTPAVRRAREALAGLPRPAAW